VINSQEIRDMHVMIRRYKMTGSMEELMRRVEAQFAKQLSTDGTAEVATPVQVPQGIFSYQAAATGNDTLVTITVFESAELLQRAQQGAADIRKSLAEFDVEEIETFSGEIAISRVSEKLLT
jgi:hypothetical protein